MSETLISFESDRELVSEIVKRLFINEKEQEIKVHFNVIRDICRVISSGQWEIGIEGSVRVRKALQNLGWYLRNGTDGSGAYVIIEKTMFEGKGTCLACLNPIPLNDMKAHRLSCWLGLACAECDYASLTREEALKHYYEARHKGIRPKEILCSKCNQSVIGYKVNGGILLQDHGCKEPSTDKPILQEFASL